MRIKTKYNLIIILALFQVLLSCKKDESSDEAQGDPDEVVSSPGELAIGGLPSEEDFEGAQEISDDQANLSAQGVGEVTSSMPLQINTGDAASTALLEGDECDEGLFCIAKAFGDIFDMVTGAAACNFKLLLKDKDGNDVPMKKVDGKPLYYVDGFGAIGLGDDGLECPSHQTVDDWAKSNRLKKGEPVTRSTSEEEFYPPSRLVIYKHRDGKIRWNVVFFPQDFISKLAERVPHFRGLVDKELDFRAFYGDQSDGSDIGKGVGQANINWDELVRMMTVFDDQNSDGGGMPQGKITVDYDMDSEINKFTTVFLDGFSFGGEDAGDNPFTIGVPTSIYRSGTENYMHFVSGQSFAKPEEGSEDDGGPMGIIQYCIDPDWRNSDEGPFYGDQKYLDVPKSSYLATESESHMQLIWTNDDDKVLENYEVAMISTKGGGYIYGDVEFRAAKKTGSTKNAIRMKAPQCADMTQEQIDELEFIMRDPDGGKSPGYTYVDDEGFRNMIFEGDLGGDNESSPTFGSKEETLKYYPSFSTFKILSKAEFGEDPLQ